MDPGVIISVLQLCYQGGVLVLEICSNWKNADAEISERVIIVESSWQKTRVQIEFVQRINSLIDDDHRRVLDGILGILAGKLSKATSSLKKVSADHVMPGAGFLGFKSRMRRGKYAFAKDTLDTLIREMEEWQRRFDPSWFLLMRMGNPAIDRELKQTATITNVHEPNNVRQPLPSMATFSTISAPSPLTLAGDIRSALRPEGPHHSVFLPRQLLEAIPIPFARAQAAKREASSGTQWFILDRLICQPGSDMSAFTDDVRELARKLSRTDPLTFGLLTCKGAMRIKSTNNQVTGFDLVLRIPSGMEILQSLRQILLNAEANASMSLTRRVRIAQELAKSISYVHTFNFVHKGICPESVLCFEDLDSARRATFLVGFGNFRSADGATILVGDHRWERNIYRHPERQGEYLQDSYKMQHDIYSLGVCLLEIGLWESFVEYTTDPTPQPTYGKAYRDFIQWAKNEKNALPGHSAGAAYSSLIAYQLKNYFVELAETRLPQLMGDRYKEVVINCLTCLDETSGDSENGQDNSDVDGISIGVQFIDEVLGRLSDITL